MAAVSTTDWTGDAVERLTSALCGYHFGTVTAAEPSALSAIALLGAGRTEAAHKHLEWLAKQQRADGSVTPLDQLPQPGWPTALTITAAVLTNRAEFNGEKTSIDGSTKSHVNNEANTTNRSLKNQSFNIPGASHWLLAAEGKTLEKSPDFGHDGMLVGWPWVLGTHSWQEPTAWSVLALKAMGMRDHSRTREGVRMLIDRLLPTGGCNYGNTYVLGQKLRAHVEPTGVTLLALAGEESDDLRIAYSIEYLAGAISEETTAISLSYGLLGLTAHQRRPAAADQWLETAYRRTVARDPSPLKIALLLLASQGADCLLIKNL